MPGAPPKLSHQLGFSQRNGISRLSLAYENPVQNGPAAHRQLIDFLGINAYYVKVAPMYFQPAAIAFCEYLGAAAASRLGNQSERENSAARPKYLIAFARLSAYCPNSFGVNCQASTAQSTSRHTS